MVSVVSRLGRALSYDKNTERTEVIVADRGWQNQGRQEHGWFGHGTSATQVNDPARRSGGSPDLPSSGLASTYADKWVGHPVAGKNRGAEFGIYQHTGYTAALLGDHRGAVPFGTHLMLRYNGRRVIVEVNDVGNGVPQEDRVLDLS